MPGATTLTRSPSASVMTTRAVGAVGEAQLARLDAAAAGAAVADCPLRRPIRRAGERQHDEAGGAGEGAAGQAAVFEGVTHGGASGRRPPLRDAASAA